MCMYAILQKLLETSCTQGWLLPYLQPGQQHSLEQFWRWIVRRWGPRIEMKMQHRSSAEHRRKLRSPLRHSFLPNFLLEFTGPTQNQLRNWGTGAIRRFFLLSRGWGKWNTECGGGKWDGWWRIRVWGSETRWITLRRATISGWMQLDENVWWMLDVDGWG